MLEPVVCSLHHLVLILPVDCQTPAHDRKQAVRLRRPEAGVQEVFEAPRAVGGDEGSGEPGFPLGIQDGIATGIADLGFQAWVAAHVLGKPAALDLDRVAPGRAAQRRLRLPFEQMQQHRPAVHTQQRRLLMGPNRRNPSRSGSSQGPWCHVECAPNRCTRLGKPCSVDAAGAPSEAIIASGRMRVAHPAVEAPVNPVPTTPCRDRGGRWGGGRVCRARGSRPVWSGPARRLR